MKKLRNCFCGLLVSVLTIIGSVSNVYASTDILSTYDSQVINMANTYVDSSTTYGNTDLNPFIKSNGGRYFTVNEIETDHFDVNVNGVVDLTDAILLNKYLAKLIQLTDIQYANANCDQTDGTDNVGDLDTTALMRFVLNVEGYQELPYIAES